MTNHSLSLYERDRQNNYILFLEKKELELIQATGLKIIKTQKKKFYCENGRIEHRFRYVKANEGRLYSPLRDYLGLSSYENMSQEFKAKLIMKASRTTYQKAVEDIWDSFGFTLSRKTLNRYVLSMPNDAINPLQEPTSKQNILIADSTKVRNGKGGHHEVMAVTSLDYETNVSSLTAFEINKPAKEIAQQIDVERYSAFVGDADLGLRNFFKDKIPFQLCHHHAINDLSFFLWKEAMRKDDRGLIIKKFKAVLYTLQNSTKKYRKTNKTGRLVNRIIRTRRNICSIAAEISTYGKHDAARYLMDHQEHMLTAAKLALVGIKCPWTTNHAERLMQEIGNRTKKKGMNWTERGLRAILYIVLKRYFLPKERRNYKEVFDIKDKKVVET